MDDSKSKDNKKGEQRKLRWRKIETETSFSPRFDHAIIATKDEIFLFGGMREGWEIQQDFWKLDDNMNKWSLFTPETKTEMPKPAKDHTAVGDHKNMYIFGGKSTDKHTLNDLYILDIGKMFVEHIPATEDVPTKTYGHSAVMHKNKMYVFGGKRHTKDESMLNELWEYDTVKKTWQLVKPKNEAPEGMQYHTAVAYDGFMWVVGGYRNKEPLREFWSMNLETFEWKRETDLPFAPRSGHAAAVLDDAMFIFSGEGKDAKGATCESDSWKFDFKKNEWEQISMEGGPAPRLGAKAEAIKGAILLTGGIRIDPSWNPEAWFNDTWKLEYE